MPLSLSDERCLSACIRAGIHSPEDIHHEGEGRLLGQADKKRPIDACLRAEQALAEPILLGHGPAGADHPCAAIRVLQQGAVGEAGDHHDEGGQGRVSSGVALERLQRSGSTSLLPRSKPPLSKRDVQRWREAAK